MLFYRGCNSTTNENTNLHEIYAITKWHCNKNITNNKK